MLVKASIAGAIVTNTLFMSGVSFLLGGIKHHTQEYNPVSARFQAGLLFLATIALLVPSAIAEADSTTGVHKQVERGTRGAAHRRLRTRHAFFAHHAPRVFRQRGTRGGRRRAVADRADIGPWGNISERLVRLRLLSAWAASLES
jgi:hypothetical protein